LRVVADRAVIFDAMGTLLDQTPIRERLVAIGAPRWALEAWFERVLHTAASLTLAGEFRPFREIARATANTTLAQLGLDPRRGVEVVASLDDLTVYPEAEAALDRLEEEGAAACVLTNGGEEHTCAILKRAGVLGRFERIFSVAAVGRYKPDPMPYRHALGELGLGPDAVAMVAAHGFDVVGARAVGIRSVWIDRLEKQWPLPLPEPPRAASLDEAAAVALSLLERRLDGRSGIFRPVFPELLTMRSPS
jgi:2-haloacid dehalogenase